MAVLSDYTSGTISLANGSATVTGTGTLFEVTRFREGDTLQIQNLTAVIASVDSDTQLTLTEPWTGASIVDGAYRARQLADGTRVGTQAATLIELLGDGTLAGIASLGVEEGKTLVGGPAGQYVLADLVTDPNGSLGKLAALVLAASKILNTDDSGNLIQSDITAAALVLLKLAGVPAANQMPYFNGVDGAALTPLTQVGRNLLGATTTAGQRTTVGLARPAFKATTSTNVSVGNGTQVVPFNTVSLNVGNGWNGTIFTAPESGVYAFSVDFNITGGTDNAGNTILSLYKDGGWWQETVRARRTDYFHSIAIVTVAYLVAGQTFQPKLALEFWAGTVYAASGRCTVAGALIG